MVLERERLLPMSPEIFEFVVTEKADSIYSQAKERMLASILGLSKSWTAFESFGGKRPSFDNLDDAVGEVCMAMGNLSTVRQELRVRQC